MKTRKVACSLCNGAGTKKVPVPHVSTPETRVCWQCRGKRTMVVCVPDDEPDTGPDSPRVDEGPD